VKKENLSFKKYIFSSIQNYVVSYCRTSIALGTYLGLGGITTGMSSSLSSSYLFSPIAKIVLFWRYIGDRELNVIKKTRLLPNHKLYSFNCFVLNDNFSNIFVHQTKRQKKIHNTIFFLSRIANKK
jgi:hypothetical protein